MEGKIMADGAESIQNLTPEEKERVARMDRERELQVDWLVHTNTLLLVRDHNNASNPG